MNTKITFTLPAGHVIGADACVLLGEFNNWNIEEGIYLQKQEDGSMRAEVELPAGRDYQYRYLLSNGRWVNDDGEKVMSEMMGYPIENCLVRVAGISVTETAVENVTAKPKAAKKTAVKKSTQSTGQAKPKAVAVKEDLTKVEGIGKKIEALLNKNKIRSYRELSKATVKSLKLILETGGSKFSMHNPGTWPKQAKLAAAGKWEELALLQQQLTGGK
jgi:predicted flap endonuclease-1-like 5' DNA nuclease